MGLDCSYNGWCGVALVVWCGFGGVVWLWWCGVELVVWWGCVGVMGLRLVWWGFFWCGGAFFDVVEICWRSGVLRCVVWL